MPEQILMEEVELPGTVPSSQNFMHVEARGTSEQGCISAIARQLRRWIEIYPNIIPLSPRTRQSANTEHSNHRRIIRLEPISLDSTLHKDNFHLVFTEGIDNITIVFVVDCKVTTDITCMNSKCRNTEQSKTIDAGLGQVVELELKYKGRSKQIFIVLTPKIKGEEQKLIQQITQIDIRPSVDGRSPEAKIISQFARYEGKDFEYLEIYDQPSCQKQKDVVIAPDNIDCVICLTNKRDTMMFPCRHMCACSDCAEVLRNTNGNCPICRQEFTNMMTIIEGFTTRMREVEEPKKVTSKL